MDELSSYGTTNEVAITLVNAEGTEKSFKIPNAKTGGDITTAAQNFANLATNSDTAVIGINGLVPVKAIVDIIETTRTNVYNS